MPTEQVIIEFVADTTQLQPAVDKLEELGQIDDAAAVIFKKTNDQIKIKNDLISQGLKNTKALTASVSDEQVIYNKLVASVKNLSGAAKEAGDKMLRFTAGDLVKSLKDQNLTIDQTIKTLQEMSDVIPPLTENTQSLKSELREISAALAVLTLNGQEGSAEFKALSLRAGEVQNALKDTRQVVQGLGEDVPILKTLGAAAQGVTAGFSVMSGAAALLGDENKDLQQVLIRVNALMAVQQGVSQLVALANDKAQISTAKLAIAQLTNNAQTAISNGLESKSIVIRGAATVAQYLLNAAMKANPIGLLVTALAAIVTAFAAFNIGAAAAKKQTEELNDAFNNADTGLANLTENIKRAGEKREADLKERNATERDLVLNQQRVLVETQQATLKTLAKVEQDFQKAQAEGFTSDEAFAAFNKLADFRLALQQKVFTQQQEIDKSSANVRKVLIDRELQDQKDAADARLSLAIKNSNDFFASQRVAANAQAAIDIKAAGDNEEKKNSIKAALHRQLLDIQAAQDQEAENRRQSGIQAALLAEQIQSRRINQETTDQETALQIKAIQDRAAFEAGLEGVSAQRKLEIQRKAQLDIEQLQRDQLQRNITLANENQNALNKVVIDDIKTTNEERLRLEIETVNNETAVSLAAQTLTEQKRLAIIADSEQKIRQLKIAAIDQETADSIALEKSQLGAQERGIQRVLDAQDKIQNAQGVGGGDRVSQQLGIARLSVNEQIGLITDLTKLQQSENEKLIASNQKKYDEGLISAQEFSVTEAGLIDQQTQIFETGEEKKQKLINDTADLQKKRTQEITQTVLQGVSEGLNVLSSLYQQQDQQDQARLDSKRKRIQEEVDAGIITQKAADIRNKELDAEQKRLQREQAQRNKELALFQAIVNTALAVTTALTAGPVIGVIQAAIAAALGAAQIAVISSQPIPQFYKGKNNDNYEGWGEIGEKGAELWKSGSQMRLAEKSTIVWLKKNDTVYNPKQTEMIMNTRIPNRLSANGGTFDYDKLAQAVAGKGVTHLVIDGYAEFIKDQENLTTILGQRSWSGK